MAFISCRKCDWQQDDFWDPNGYHPFRKDIVEWLTECLFRDVVTTVDDVTGKVINMGGREFVARELDKMARRIRGMKWSTEEAWRADPNRWQCPNCLQNGLSVD